MYPTHLPTYLPQVFSYLVTFSTIIVVVATSCWARVLHQAGKTIPVVGDIKAGWNPVNLPSFGDYPTTDAFVQGGLGVMEDEELLSLTYGPRPFSFITHSSKTIIHSIHHSFNHFNLYTFQQPFLFA